MWLTLRILATSGSLEMMVKTLIDLQGKIVYMMGVADLQGAVVGMAGLRCCASGCCWFDRCCGGCGWFARCCKQVWLVYKIQVGVAGLQDIVVGVAGVLWVWLTWDSYCSILCRYS